MFYLFVMLLSLGCKVCAMRCHEFSFVLKQSSQGNIGMFAAHDIAKGTLILDKPFKLRVMKTVEIPEEFKQFSIPINDIESACPERFDRMEIYWYINDSSIHPNIEKRIEVDYPSVIDLLEALTFYAIRDIKAGEEILIDLHKVQQSF